MLGNWQKWIAVGLGMLILTGCDVPGTDPGTTPEPRPPGLNTPAPEPTGPAEPSAASQDLARYYGRLQADLLAQDLLRTGGGGVDTPYNDSNLMRNFEKIAFFSEYQANAGLTPSEGAGVRLSKWTAPVRFNVEFGPSVPQDQRAEDMRFVTRYSSRLARITGHPISVDSRRANFHVLIASEDDRPQTLARIREIAPDIQASSLAAIRNLPRSILCVVVTFPGAQPDYSISRAIAVIRSEQPPLMRRACVHEELAQGLGLPNDSPYARPSIFNDDEEFALLTTHDEELLRILYNPALTPGMSAEDARPIVRQILAGRAGPS